MINFFKKNRLKKEIKHLKKSINGILVHDDDIIFPKDKIELKSISDKLKGLQYVGYEKAQAEYVNLLTRYTKIVPVKKFRIIREYAEIVVVALTVAFGIRALYLQPFKIPTSSMQPTLFGIHYVEKDTVPETVPQPVNYLLYSTLRAKAIIEKEGSLEGLFPPYNKFLIFPWTSFEIGDEKYSLPGDTRKVIEYCFSKYMEVPTLFPVGYTLCNGWLSEGDHLFVNRLAYHFIEPKRGDIVVFSTSGLKNDSSGELLSSVGFYYVKRLIGMPGDTLKIVDKKLLVKEKGATEFKPITDFNIEAFNRIYSNKGGYQGYLPLGRLASGNEVVVPDKNYFMLGDNTLWSADSRYWGFVPRSNIVGRASFVFWPFTRRWGIADNKPPVDCSTTVGPNGYIKAMELQ